MKERMNDCFMPSLFVHNVPAEHPSLHLLIAKLDSELLERYPADEIFGLDFNDPDIHEVIFAVAFKGDQPIGCGAIRPLDGQAVELKRFFVEREFRGMGAAAAILMHLESTAVQQGYRYIRLETGPEQPESLRFYSKHGYYEIPRYGPYVDCHSSMCFEKAM
jgi:putative acetyltransferase